MTHITYHNNHKLPDGLYNMITDNSKSLTVTVTGVI